MARTFHLALFISIAAIVVVDIGRAYTILDINDAKEYNNFKSGLIGANYDIVYIRPSAHPTPLLEPKYFSNVSNYKISFSDKNGNLIDIYPRNQGVQISLSLDNTVDFDIPQNFKEYKIAIDESVVLTEVNVNSLLNCTSATYLSIYDARDLAVTLMKHIDALRQMTQLKTLKMNINNEYLEQIKLTPFLEQIPSLQFATFVFQDLREHQVEAYLKSQDIPSDWVRHGNYVDSAIFHRKG